MYRVSLSLRKCRPDNGEAQGGQALLPTCSVTPQRAPPSDERAALHEPESREILSGFSASAVKTDTIGLFMANYLFTQGASREWRCGEGASSAEVTDQYIFQG